MRSCKNIFCSRNYYTYIFYSFLRNLYPIYNSGSNEISVIFGGKYVEDPTSIPEELADILVEEATNWNDSRVYTISTTEGAKKSEGKYKHFREDLENEPPFSSTLLNVLEENKGNESRLVLYFTLGRHVGENPFEFNVKVATYFANSLKKNKSALIRLKKNFRVVVTGTEATKPNTALDKKVSIDKTVYIQPTYKIGEGNFMYAMSKICQFYIVAEALVDIFNLTLDSSIDLAGTIEKMKTAIHESKGSGKYADGKYMTYEVLNKISTDWDTIEKTLEQYIRVAPGISICYTPLHANPWTEKALGIESPRAYIIDNIVFRLRNAISNERAARLHLF